MTEMRWIEYTSMKMPFLAHPTLQHHPSSLLMWLYVHWRQNRPFGGWFIQSAIPWVYTFLMWEAAMGTEPPASAALVPTELYSIHDHKSENKGGKDPPRCCTIHYGSHENVADQRDFDWDITWVWTSRYSVQTLARSLFHFLLCPQHLSAVRA